ncbi:MAG TPA: FlgD immunoglobulin-like domain containing protein [Candidatus Krumholzibacteria bacterium]|nr:FlgD immunoglobulin-like domain containing protein [Candidatus Krumholzibacteria bacterium]
MPSGPRPGDGATDQAITGGLQWIGGEAVAYDVYFGTEEDPPLVASNVPDHFYQGGTLAFATVYRWRIVARDQFGAETSGPVWSFVTRENSPPIAPFDPNPPNLGLTGPAVVLGWRSGDPDLQPVTYRLFFGATNPPPQIAIGLTTRSYPIDGLQLNTTYYWRVIATDGEFSTSSLVWRFHVIQLAVLISKFDAAQVGDGVDVTWELSSDEPIESLTLYRRAAGESLPVPLATVDTGARVFRDETVEAGKTYHYELVVRTLDEDVYRSPVATVTMRERALALLQNHPNPFNPQTTISYDLPHVDAPQHVRLSVFDVGGRTIRTLVNQEQPSGSYAVVWEGIDNYGGAVPSGVYFYVLDVDGVRRTRKMVLLK